MFLQSFKTIPIEESECWAPKVADMQRLRSTERWMLRWMKGGNCEPTISNTTLLNSFGLSPLSNVMRANRLRWYGHVQRSDNWINRCLDLNLPGPNPPGRPLKTWKETIKHDLEAWKMPPTCNDRAVWRNRIRECIQSNPM